MARALEMREGIQAQDSLNEKNYVVLGPRLSSPYSAQP